MDLAAATKQQQTVATRAQRSLSAGDEAFNVFFVMLQAHIHSCTQQAVSEHSKRVGSCQNTYAQQQNAREARKLEPARRQTAACRCFVTGRFCTSNKSCGLLAQTHDTLMQAFYWLEHTEKTHDLSPNVECIFSDDATVTKTSSDADSAFLFHLLHDTETGSFYSLSLLFCIALVLLLPN